MCFLIDGSSIIFIAAVAHGCDVPPVLHVRVLSGQEAALNDVAPKKDFLELALIILLRETRALITPEIFHG